MCSSKHVETLINFGIINSITKLHLVGISTESGFISQGISQREGKAEKFRVSLSGIQGILLYFVLNSSVLRYLHVRETALL